MIPWIKQKTSLPEWWVFLCCEVYKTMIILTPGTFDNSFLKSDWKVKQRILENDVKQLASSHFHLPCPPSQKKMPKRRCEKNIQTNIYWSCCHWVPQRHLESNRLSCWQRHYCKTIKGCSSSYEFLGARIVQFVIHSNLGKLPVQMMRTFPIHRKMTYLISYMAVSSKGGTPQSLPQKWSFVSRKTPWLLGCNPPF